MSDQGTKTVLESTRHFIRNTPTMTYPAELAARHPYILDKIVELHLSRDELRAYFDSLVNDERGGRNGFVFEVLMEIQALREFFLGDVNGFELDDSNKWVS